ncbi:MAG: PaaI family thioesterase [Gammaproteobacteria bacterium]
MPAGSLDEALATRYTQHMMQRNTNDGAISEAQRLGFAALAARGLEIPMDESGRRRWQDNFNSIPAMHYMGCRLDMSHENVVVVRLPEVRPHHQGGMGTEAVNGAVIAGLCDCALGVAGVVHFPDQRAGTVELAIKFMRPTVGQSVTAYAVALKRAASVAFAEVELYSAGRLCSIATGMVSTASS